MSQNGKAKPKPRSLPDWHHDFLTTIDGNCSLAYALKRRHEALQDHVSNGEPDNLTYPQRSLIRRAIWLEARIETDEEGFALGNPLSPGAHATMLNALTAIYRTLGIEPRQKSVVSLSEYIEASKSDA